MDFEAEPVGRSQMSQLLEEEGTGVRELAGPDILVSYCHN